MVTKKQKRINWILVAVLLVLSVFFLFPVIWMLANSFKPDAAITADMNSIAAFIPPACRIKNNRGRKTHFRPLFHGCGALLRETHAEGIALRGGRG